jgi:epoxyqueuosine reductase
MNRVTNIIRSVLASQLNRLDPTRDEPVWEDFLVGVARGDDALWDIISTQIGPFHWRPDEAFAKAFPGQVSDPGRLRVIVWVLPHTKATLADHRRGKDMPSLRWSQSRHYGEQLNQALRLKVAEGLTAIGHPAVAPSRLPDWGRQQSPNFGFASNWSERHAAFVAGLGTFGLSDGLITPRGVAVRFGSVVAEIDLPPTPRPYGNDHHAYCLHFSQGSCAVCAKRCPAKAITAEGHDKVACKAYIRGVTSPYVTEKLLGFPVNSCGLCQAGVPCQSRIPGSRVR